MQLSDYISNSNVLIKISMQVQICLKNDFVFFLTGSCLDIFVWRCTWRDCVSVMTWSRTQKRNSNQCLQFWIQIMLHFASIWWFWTEFCQILIRFVWYCFYKINYNKICLIRFWYCLYKLFCPTPKSMNPNNY